jgi:hypothetical protein
MSSQLRTVESDDAFSVTLFGRFALIDVIHSMDLARMHKAEAALDRLIGEGRAPIGVLATLRCGAPVPPAGARRYAARLINARLATIGLIAVYVEDGGIMARMFETVVRSINVLSGSARMVVYTDLGEAERALCTTLFQPDEVVRERALLHAAVTATAGRTHQPQALGAVGRA